MNNSKGISEEKFPDRKCFYRSTKDKTTGDNGEKLDSHITHLNLRPFTQFQPKIRTTKL